MWKYYFVLIFHVYLIMVISRHYKYIYPYYYYWCIVTYDIDLYRKYSQYLNVNFTKININIYTYFIVLLKYLPLNMWRIAHKHREGKMQKNWKDN